MTGGLQTDTGYNTVEIECGDDGEAGGDAAPSSCGSSSFSEVERMIFLFFALVLTATEGVGV